MHCYIPHNGDDTPQKLLTIPHEVTSHTTKVCKNLQYFETKFNLYNYILSVMQQILKIINEEMEANASAIHKAAVMQLEPIRTRGGVFQGDFLLLLLFCMRLVPLINKLNIYSLY